MLPDRVSNPGPLTYESGTLPIALRGPAQLKLHLPCLLSCKIELESGCQLSVANSQEIVRWHLAAV